jgi:CysZ protein
MDIFLGPKYVLEGYRMILKPGLRRFVGVPLLINITVFFLLIWISVSQFGRLLDFALPDGDNGWIKIVRPILWSLFVISELLILLFSFTALANLIASPFNAILAEKVEIYLIGENPRKRASGLFNILAGFFKDLLNELRKFLYFLIFGSLAFALSLIPVLHVFSPFIWLIFGSWMMAFEYLSYPLENHGLLLKQVRARLSEKRLMSLSFGLSVMVATLIPIINFFVMPAAVAGATCLWVKQQDKRIGSPLKISR